MAKPLVTERFACFGGDRPINQVVENLLGQKKAQNLYLISKDLLKTVRQLSHGSRFDFLSVVQTWPNMDNKDALGVLAALSTSGNSGLTGWLQSVEDRWLIEGVIVGAKSAEIYLQAKYLQAAKLRYKLLRDFVESNKIKITIGKHDVQHWNRHNFMAAFLGCYFSDHNPIYVQNFISLVGVGYEAKDFTTHLKEKMSIKDAKENFQTDTQRYRESVSVGLRLCASAPEH